MADLKKATEVTEILGVGRLIKEHGTDEAEFAVLISDPWQGKGLGTELLDLLVRIGRKERLHRIVGHIAADNVTMKRVSEEVGFRSASRSRRRRMASGNLTMKVAVFSTRKYDREFLAAANVSRHDFHFFEPQLERGNRRPGGGIRSGLCFR